MKNDITKLTAYEIGILLEKRKIDPISLLEIFLENYNLAEEGAKRGVSKILKKNAFIEAKLSWQRQKNNNRLSHIDGIPSARKDSHLYTSPIPLDSLSSRKPSSA